MRKEKKNKQAHAFAVVTVKRVFFMYPDAPSDTDPWITALSNQIDVLKGNKKPVATTVVSTPAVVATAATAPVAKQTAVGKHISSKPSTFAFLSVF